MTSLSADDSLLNHYGFSHDPFATRVPGFKFFPAQRKPVLGQLHHLARYSQLLLVVTGPEGSGKTLVRQALVASSNKQAVQSVVITPQTTMDSNLVLQQVAQALGSARADFDSIMAQVIQLALTGQEIYLLVDDAERLTGAAVETLLRLAAGSPEGRPHVFLFGEESLLARLEALVDGEERFHAIALQPYEEDETREYLSLRLEGAGGGLECLTEEQIVRIHEQSGGWPGAINQVAREELIDAMHHSRAKRKAAGWGFPLPMKHLLALLAVLLIVVIGLVFIRDGSDEPAVAPATTSLPLGSAGVAPTPGDAQTPVAPPEPQAPIVREPLAAAGSADVEDFPQQDAPAVTPAPVIEPLQREPESNTVPVAPPTPVPQPAAPAPAPAPAAPEPARPAAPAAATASSWYGSQPTGNYLIQILGTRNESNAQALVKQHGSDFRYFTKQHEGKPLYVVTYGSFPNRNAATQAIKKLPAPLQAGKPWVRSFSGVQQEIARMR